MYSKQELQTLLHSYSKGLLCLYDKQNNTWLLVDMKFQFSCSTRHLTRSLHLDTSLLRFKYLKSNSISTHANVSFSICMSAYYYFADG